jgi:S-adenosylmethionine-diacylglycerol 3-amino-3-carboxypropyl transferase
MSFERTLNFTSANEDGASELAALALSQRDRVLCLTASGGRPLDLLLGDPGQLIALDLNVAQNQLLALKIAAIRVLDDDALLAYLGILPSDRRLALHARVSAALPPETRAFWDARLGVIRRGVWYAGRWEKVLRFGAFGTGLLRGRHVEALFAASSLEHQAEIWTRHFDDGVWRAAIRLLSQRWFWTRVIGEPGGAFLPPAATCEARLAGRFNHAAHNLLFRESDFAWLIFLGRHDRAALPLHLRPEALPLVRARLDRIQIVHGGLSDLGDDRFGAFDAYSLSDFGSYCRPSDYDACWRGVLASARPGARYCERVFMNPLTPAADIQARLSPMPDTGAALTAADRAFIYDIRCGTIGA